MTDLSHPAIPKTRTRTWKKQRAALCIAASPLAGVLGSLGCEVAPDVPTQSYELRATGIIGEAPPNCGSLETNEPPGHSVRLLTFNTHLISPMFNAGALELTNDNVFEDAQRIASELKKGDFDVIALNEVFDEEAREAMHELCERYPHWVKAIDMAEDLPLEDSGLMLYSKLPFADLPNTQFVATGSTTSLGDDSDRVAFRDYYDSSVFPDSMAIKGAALTRLIHPASEQIINLMFTHMQADEEEHDSRHKQFARIRAESKTISESGSNEDLLAGSLDFSSSEHLYRWPNEDWIVLAGDLNVRGETARNDSVGGDQIDDPCAVMSDADENTCRITQEWIDRIGAPTSAGPPSALYDAWAETTSPKDVGYTSGVMMGAQRLDYILASRITHPVPDEDTLENELCVQHIWTPPELDGISDHRPVAADLNLGAPQCNPRRAHTFTDDELGVQSAVPLVSKPLLRSLRHPGSMQWFYFSEPGTYVVTTALNSGIVHDLYTEDNLSVPLEGSHDLGPALMRVCKNSGADLLEEANCKEYLGKKVYVPTAGYLRVYNTDRAWSGDYWLAVHKFTCKSEEEACALMPNHTGKFAFPDNDLLNPTGSEFKDTAWFSLDIENQALSGHAQSLRFFASNDHCCDDWSEPPLLDLLKKGSSSPLGELDGNPIVKGGSGVAPGVGYVERETETDQNGSYFLRVHRTATGEPLTLRVGWQTDLTLLGGLAIAGRPAEVVCEDETDPEYGSDEIVLELNVDNMGWQPYGSHDFDCNNQPVNQPWDDYLGVIGFVDSLRVRFRENDDGPDNFSMTLTIDSLVGSNVDPASGFESQKEWVTTFEGGTYKFRYGLGKSTQ